MAQIVLQMAQIFHPKKIVIMYANVNGYDAYACNAYCKQQQQKEVKNKSLVLRCAPKMHAKQNIRHFMKFKRIVK